MSKGGNEMSEQTVAHATTLDTPTIQQSMLTTVDNPFDPFTQFDDWYAFDVGKNYNTCQYLGRIVRTSDSLSEADQDIAIENAIDEIVRLNILGIYRKVFSSIDK